MILSGDTVIVVILAAASIFLGLMNLPAQSRTSTWFLGFGGWLASFGCLLFFLGLGLSEAGAALPAITGVGVVPIAMDDIAEDIANGLGFFPSPVRNVILGKVGGSRFGDTVRLAFPGLLGFFFPLPFKNDSLFSVSSGTIFCNFGGEESSEMLSLEVGENCGLA